jgi:hypothetical protein
MKFFLIAAIMIAPAVARTQLQQFDIPFLGQPIEKFKDSIICADASRFNKTYENSPGCMSFRLLSADTLLYGFGNIKFATVILSPDSTGRINHISYFTVGNTDIIIEETEKGFSELSALFKSRFPVKAKKTYESSEYEFTRRLTWQINPGKLILSHTSFKKNKKRKKVSILNVDVLL